MKGTFSLFWKNTVLLVLVGARVCGPAGAQKSEFSLFLSRSKRLVRSPLGTKSELLKLSSIQVRISIQPAWVLGNTLDPPD